MCNDFETAIIHIDGYLHGLSELCHRTNYVPLYKAIACPQLANEITIDLQQAKILAISSEYGFNEGTECNNFQLISDWQTSLGDSINRWICKRILAGDIQSSCYLSLSRRITNSLVWSIRKAIEPDEPQVWKFQIGVGCHYNWGFDNESYAFKSKNKLFIMTFGWAD